MAKGKKEVKETPAVAKSKKPRFKGANHPANCPKGFRTKGNKFLVRAFLNKK